MSIELLMWVDECGDCHHYAKGHHSDESFIAAMVEQRFVPDEVGELSRGYFRNVPDNNPAHEFDTRFVPAAEGDRGAWPVTIEDWNPPLALEPR